MTVINEREVQVGDQGTWGTAVAPTIFLAGMKTVSMPPSIVTEIQPDIMRGMVGPGQQIVTPRHESRGVGVRGI